MFDSKGRNIHYLRLSVTDLCNLRCRYCMPDGVDKLEREDILTYEEFLRLAALFARCGVDTVRVTGGEPQISGFSSCKTVKSIRPSFAVSN